MKTFIVILMTIGLLMLIPQCQRTTEQRIIKRIDETSFYPKSRIVKVDVIDTLYQKDINEALRMDTLRLEFLNEKYQLFDSLKNEVRKSPRPNREDTVGMRYVKGVFDSLMFYDRWTDMTKDRSNLYNRIGSYYNAETNIVGYRVLIHYKDGRVNDFVIESDYSMLCPYFMFEPLDSVFKFRPNFRRHEQRPNRPIQREFSVNRPRVHVPKVVE